ncbi:MAG: DUF2892 domain-containing protein [Sulfurospirillaceae bacterium]|jgi:hypothetical protein|nr:DUF2892 domain-containing protein [Sulfurospirillaceae bacterium]MDD2826906.1 DUF2892 domain-containing protein [Sulfurospirillaceae bacterium]
MTCNVGKTDKAIRAIAGIAIIIAGIVYGSWFGAIGAVLLFTAAIGWCPAYIPFKINTSKNDSCGSGGCGCGK